MIQMEFHLAEDLKVVNADPGQVEQVLMNLAVNSRDAMPKGGWLKLTTSYIPDDNFVMVALADSGRGIPEKIMNRIYEPFFSTKEAGTGLGLSISYSIVEVHGGHIEVESQVGVGSKFSVYLPVRIKD